MNPLRVEARKMGFRSYRGAVLEGYRLAFNKRSVKYPGAASANVMSSTGHRVEGVLYELQDPGQIYIMDPHEGYPVRYARHELPVTFDDVSVSAWVYVATPEYIVEGLKPARWYLDHLLAGRPYLSPAYYEELSIVECLPDSSVEPA